MKSSAPALTSLAGCEEFIVDDHLERMQRYVEILLDHCQDDWHISPEDKEKIIVVSVLHDAGKMVIPVEILAKPTRLTEEEFNKVKLHTIAAAEVFAKASVACEAIGAEGDYMALAMDIALHHHEKWNGTGYPLRLKGEEIPFPARVVAIADVYDALTSERPYKEPWTHEEAFKTIVDDSGRHFDPALVEVFKRCAEKFRMAPRDE